MSYIALIDCICDCRPITDFNEITFHFLEVIYVHLSNIKAQVITSSYFKLQFSPHVCRIDCTRGLIMFWFWVVRIFVLSATMPLSCRCVLGRVLSFRLTYSAFEPTIAESQLMFFPHILVTIHKHSSCSYMFHWLVCSCTNEGITFVCRSLVVFRSW